MDQNHSQAQSNPNDSALWSKRPKQQKRVKLKKKIADRTIKPPDLLIRSIDWLNPGVGLERQESATEDYKLTEGLEEDQLRWQPVHLGLITVLMALVAIYQSIYQATGAFKLNIFRPAFLSQQNKLHEFVIWNRT